MSLNRYTIATSQLRQASHKLNAGARGLCSGVQKWATRRMIAWAITNSLPPPWGAVAAAPIKPSHPIDSATLSNGTNWRFTNANKSDSLGSACKKLNRTVRIALACITQMTYLIELNNVRLVFG